LQVSLVLWLLAGIGGDRRIVLRGRHLLNIGVRRHSAYRALKLLEAAGLVKVERRRGRSPVVTLLAFRPWDKTSRAAAEPGGTCDVR
jgi:DNA-binding transcriptional ArsR family regulator